MRQPPYSHGSTRQKAAKLQLSYMRCAPLQGILQNGINFSLFNGKKSKKVENDVFLHQFNKILAQIP
ncbi:hypothetical protein E2R60_09945 [Paenibacillus dendritiformis]|uniref:hypothetical protein n=1 Tax=Paenibacillus dendritiformis TaxID=130049 RepID=UPI00105A2EE4|nr:hypothetical protein [Paenibacillus dendritiformis]TDL55844.1 hypothetical protein E2R60_09945 [Paenibacillus dendritiformis]